MSDKTPAVRTHRTVAVVEPVDWVALAQQNLPEPDDDVMARIAAQVLAAETPDDLDTPWSQEGMREFFHVPLRVWSVRWADSEYEEGPPIFIIVEADRMDTGEPIVTTCGAEAVMAQLIKAHMAGWLPLDVKPTPARKPTKSGNMPYHLEVLGQPL